MAQYAMTRAIELLRSKDGPGVIELLEPHLRELQVLDAYEREQAQIGMYLSLAYASQGEYDKAFHHLECAYMVAEDEELQARIWAQQQDFQEWLEQQSTPKV